MQRNRALARVAQLRLSSLLTQQLKRIRSMSSQGQIAQLALPKQLIAPSSPCAQEVNSLIVILSACIQRRLVRERPSASPSQIQQATRQEIEQLLIQVVKTERASCPKPDCSCQKQPNQINVQQAQTPTKLHEIPGSPLPSSIHIQTLQAKQVECYSTNTFFKERHLKFDAVCKKQEQDWRGICEASSQSGHFLLGDKIDRIRELLVIEGELFGVIEWMMRESEAPRQSVIELSTIREHCPRELASFLQSYGGSLGQGSD